jgi:hypothetical protein
MNRLLVPLSFLVLTPAAIVAQQPDPQPPQAKLAATVKELVADLKEVRELLKKVDEKGTRDRIELLITRSELKATELEKALAGPASSHSMAISPENFATLLKSVRAANFDDARLDVVTTFAKHGLLSCDQARQLLKTFSFDEAKVKAAVALYPRLTDRENFFTVLEVFSFDSSRRELREKIDRLK